MTASWRSTTRAADRGNFRFAVVGIVLIVTIVAAIALVLVAFTGHFSSYDVVYADVPASGTGIDSGSTVIFRDITVGTVANVGHLLPNGILHAELHIDPKYLSAIPADVKADVEIATIFGTEGINLVPPDHPVPGHLALGQTIPTTSQSLTTTLQGDATGLDNILNALHPAAVDQTLTAIATALAGRGQAIGTTIDSVASYLSEMLPQLPVLDRDIQLGGQVANELSQAAPGIISALSNASVTAGTITGDASQLHNALAGGTPLANELSSLLAGIASPFEDLVNNSAPLLGDVASNPDFVAQTLHGLDSWSKAFVVAESHGPYLAFSGNLDIAASAQVILAALGVPGSNALIEQGLGAQNFNPPTYTAADCPTYGTQKGTNCPKASASAASTQRAVPKLSIPISAAEAQASVAIATGLNGGKPPPSPAVVSLLLEPLLAGLAGVS
ncbi:MAG TPA: MCE family protein [Acidimicrobiales bacterium]|nr:MCE family protein [Acidimicrobiales bacterium]